MSSDSVSSGGSFPLALPKPQDSTGFSETEVTDFLQGGNTQSSSQSFDLLRPTIQTRTDSPSDVGAASFGVRTPTVSTGFLGAFSDITSDQLDALVNTFNNRKKTILDRKRAPGRSQVFLQGRN